MSLVVYLSRTIPRNSTEYALCSSKIGLASIAFLCSLAGSCISMCCEGRGHNAGSNCLCVLSLFFWFVVLIGCAKSSFYSREIASWRILFVANLSFIIIAFKWHLWIIPCYANGLNVVLNFTKVNQHYPTCSQRFSYSFLLSYFFAILSLFHRSISPFSPLLQLLLSEFRLISLSPRATQGLIYSCISMIAIRGTTKFLIPPIFLVRKNYVWSVASLFFFLLAQITYQNQFKNSVYLLSSFNITAEQKRFSKLRQSKWWVRNRWEPHLACLWNLLELEGIYFNRIYYMIDLITFAKILLEDYFVVMWIARTTVDQ